MSTAMTLVTNEIAVRISLDRYNFPLLHRKLLYSIYIQILHPIFYYTGYFLSVAKYADALYVFSINICPTENFG